MNCYLPESMQRCPPGYSRAELEDALREGKILTARAVRCSEGHDLLVDLGDIPGRIPRLEAADGIASGAQREIAILSCVGRPVSFRVTAMGADGTALLSRRLAQREAMEHLLRTASPGDILPAVVTNCTAFGAFCDVGCGAAALLGIARICVSRISHAAERFAPGQPIFAAVHSIDRVRRRIFLTHKELLGTWAENAAAFRPGQTVTGIVRSQTDYGTFVELTPNLSGLAECAPSLCPGDHVAVYIKSITPETLKIKLSILSPLPPQPRGALHYFKTGGHLDQWRYGNEHFAKCYTIF